MSSRILWVDDDANILAGFQRNLRKQFTIHTALGGEQGLGMIKDNGPYAVVVADMQMPGMNGLQFLSGAERLAPNTVRIMLTGNADQKTAMDAVNQGHVFRFLTKPCPVETLQLTLEAGLKQFRLITAEREVLENTLNGAIKVLTSVLATLDPTSFGLSEKLRDYMRLYTSHYKLPNPWTLELGAMLSQIGYVAIPATVLMKVRSGLGLQPEEKDMLMRVPRTGAELLSNIPRLDSVVRIILYHQKNFDGSGFPVDDVSGPDIPIGARVLRILVELVRLESKGYSRFKAVAEMRARVGCFDPGVLDLIAACFDISLPQSDAERKLREVHLKNVTVGHVFAAKVETCDGALIVPTGTIITSMLLERLRNFDQLNGLKLPLWIYEQDEFTRVQEPLNPAVPAGQASRGEGFHP